MISRGTPRSQCGTEPVEPPIVRAMLRLSAVACSSRASSAAKSSRRRRAAAAPRRGFSRPLSRAWRTVAHAPSTSCSIVARALDPLLRVVALAALAQPLGHVA